MSDGFLNLSIPWMALIIFAATYLIAACVYLVVVRLAVGDRAREAMGVVSDFVGKEIGAARREMLAAQRWAARWSR